MSEIVNLRRVRKVKKREADAARADANRIAHGVPKSAKELGQARAALDAARLKAHRLDKKD